MTAASMKGEKINGRDIENRISKIERELMESYPVTDTISFEPIGESKEAVPKVTDAHYDAYLKKFDYSKGDPLSKDDYMTKNQWYVKWYSGETKVIDVPQNSPLHRYNEMPTANLGLHYGGSDEDIQKVDLVNPNHMVFGPNKPFKVLHVGDGNTPPPKKYGYYSTKHQGYSVLISIQRNEGGEPLIASIGHTTVVNKMIVDAARSGRELPAHTFIGASGEIGYLQAGGYKGSGAGGLHAHYTFSEPREKALKIYNETKKKGGK